MNNESQEIENTKSTLQAKNIDNDELIQDPIELPTSHSLINEAREMVQKSDIVTKDCLEKLEQDIQEFERKKSNLLTRNAKKVESLLDNVGYESTTLNETTTEIANFIDSKNVDSMDIKNLSAAKFSSFLIAFILALGAVAGWIYIATQKLGITLDVKQLSSQESQHQILTWIGKSVMGAEGTLVGGLGVLGVSAVGIFLLAYFVRVALRANSNMKKAIQTKEDAHFYCNKKEECRQEMERVSEHIHKVIKLLATYDALLNEQGAKLERIIFIEGKLPFHEYHQNSKNIINETGKLMSSLDALVSTAMADSQNGSLSIEAREVFVMASRAQQEFISSLYR